jgi:hypothetical protein
MVAGLPAVTFSLSYTLANGFSERMDGIALFIQETEYELSCEYTPEHAGEIQAGCDQAIDTLHIK